MNQKRVTRLIQTLKLNLQMLESELMVKSPHSRVPSTTDLYKEIELFQEWVDDGDVWEKLDVAG
jgi:hypothetical protein